MSDRKKDFGPSESKTSSGKQLAEAGLSSVLLNTYTSRMYAQAAAGDMDFTECFKVVVDKAKKITKNDTSELEITLSAQVGSLDAIFASMARMAATSINDQDLHAVEAYMRIALKAQAQCARTIEVLANIKNPPIVYAKQANIANGHQQINNGVPQSGIPHAHVEKQIQQNELLSENLNETMDIRGAATPGKADQAVETVETKYRRKDRRR